MTWIPGKKLKFLHRDTIPIFMYLVIMRCGKIDEIYFVIRCFQLLVCQNSNLAHDKTMIVRKVLYYVK